MGKDNDFGLQSNAGVSQADAVATIDRVASAPAPTSAGQSDLGVAQADGKKTDADGLKKEFDLNDPNAAAEPTGEPEKVTEVDTDPEPAAEPEKQEKPAELPDADDAEPVAEWLKDVDVATRQDILSEFMATNMDDLKVTVRQSGRDVEMSLSELKRQASGYAGEDKASKQIKQATADIEHREKVLKDREKFIADQFTNPTDLMQFLDSHVEDPIAYFTSVKEHAEGVLSEAEENPARFRRDAALRRENASLKSDIRDIKDMIRNGTNGATGTPRAEGADDDHHAIVAEEEARKAEGKARVQFVKDEGFELAAVAAAWTADNEPADFYRWFASWSLKRERDTSRDKVTATKQNRQRGGGTLRKRGSANPQPAKAVDDGKPLDAKGISEFLKNHPSNRGRL
jgi:hypothetical protein